MTDLEKLKYITAYLNLYTETYMKKSEIELAVYYQNDYLGSLYFDFDGSYIDY